MNRLVNGDILGPLTKLVYQFVTSAWQENFITSVLVKLNNLDKLVKPIKS